LQSVDVFYVLLCNFVTYGITFFSCNLLPIVLAQEVELPPSVCVHCLSELTLTYCMCVVMTLAYKGLKVNVRSQG